MDIKTLTSAEQESRWVHHRRSEYHCFPVSSRRPSLSKHYDQIGAERLRYDELKARRIQFRQEWSRHTTQWLDPSSTRLEEHDGRQRTDYYGGRMRTTPVAALTFSWGLDYQGRMRRSTAQDLAGLTNGSSTSYTLPAEA